MPPISNVAEMTVREIIMEVPAATSKAATNKVATTRTVIKTASRSLSSSRR